MSLQHELRHTGVRVPELDTTVLGTTQYPVAMGRKCDTKHKVLMALECANALSGRVVCSGDEAVAGGQLPHLDRLVQTATDQTVARRSKCHTVDAILVAMFALKSDDKLAGLNVPHTDTLVERPSGNVKVVGRDGHGGDSVLDGEVGDLHIGLEIPKADTPVATTRGDDLAISSKIERVNVLLVTGKLMLDSTASDIPDLVVMSVIAFHSCSN